MQHCSCINKEEADDTLTLNTLTFLYCIVQQFEI